MKLCHFGLSEKYCISYCTNIIKIYSCDRNEKNCRLQTFWETVLYKVNKKTK